MKIELIKIKNFDVNEMVVNILTNFHNN